jgi:hypothetical protein
MLQMCNGFSLSKDRDACIKFAESTARNVEQMLPSYSPQEICKKLCPVCSRGKNRDRNGSGSETPYACDSCVVATYGLKSLIQQYGFSHVSSFI